MKELARIAIEDYLQINKYDELFQNNILKRGVLTIRFYVFLIFKVICPLDNILVIPSKF